MKYRGGKASIVPYESPILSHLLSTQTRTGSQVWVQVPKYGSRFPSMDPILGIYLGPGSQVQVQVPEYRSWFPSTEMVWPNIGDSHGKRGCPHLKSINSKRGANPLERSQIALDTVNTPFFMSTILARERKRQNGQLIPAIFKFQSPKCIF